MKNNLIFGQNNLRSPDLQEKLPLIRYGDTWTRLSFDGKLYIGIPLFQNFLSIEKIIKNLRIFVVSDEIEKQIEGTFSILDVATSDHLTQFLNPGSNLIIIYSANFIEYLQSFQKIFSVFIFYDILDEKGNNHTLQILARKLLVNDDFLIDTHMDISIGSRKNLLSILTITKCWSFAINYKKENVLQDLTKVLNSLNFKKYISDSLLCSQEFEKEDAFYFYNDSQTSVFNGVLVFLKENTMKIYSDFECKVLSLNKIFEDRIEIKINDLVNDLSENNIFMENCKNEFELIEELKNKIKDQPSTSRGNTFVKVRVKELQKLSDLQLATDLEYLNM